MRKFIREAVIIAYGRSAVGKAPKGMLKNTHPVDFAAQVLSGVLKKVSQLDVNEIEDVIIGCAKPEGVQGANVARLILLRAGLPVSIPGQTINRFCSSGLQAISTAANMIRTGDADIVVAGGVESMSMIPMYSDSKVRNKWLEENTDVYMPMGLTAEKVVELYNIKKIDMDQMAVDSNNKAAKAQEAGAFDNEIIPVEALDDQGNKIIFNKDEGVRIGTSLESVSKLKTPFKEDGTVTAATSSQISDGASIVVLMSKEKAVQLEIKPLAKFIAHTVVGVEPNVMGIGPMMAVPKVMEKSNLTINDMDVIEINEAFASQSIACIQKLKLNNNIVNINGGALALGHPLGATGAILTCKTLSELKRIGGKYGLVTMCIGGGMGAAAIFENLDI